MEDRFVETSHAKLAVTLVGKGTPAILMIHGNSFERTIFKHILASDLATNHQLIAVDLPGHGDSSNAFEPERSYTQRSYADAMFQVLGVLEVKQVIVIGWSLGGHIGIEMAAALQSKSTDPGTEDSKYHISIKGIMLIGTPPVNRGEVTRAFTLGPGDSWQQSYAARDNLTPQEQDEYAHVCADPPYESWMTDAVTRCDQRARSIMFGDFVAPDAELWQRRTVESDASLLWAVVNGAKEPWIDLQFIRDIKFVRLWRDECIEIPELLHAPFWARPAMFQVLLAEFVAAAHQS